MLIKKGANVNAADHNGDTPMHQAAAEGKHKSCLRAVDELCMTMARVVPRDQWITKGIQKFNKFK